MIVWEFSSALAQAAYTIVFGVLVYARSHLNQTSILFLKARELHLVALIYKRWEHVACWIPFYAVYKRWTWSSIVYVTVCSQLSHSLRTVNIGRFWLERRVLFQWEHHATQQRAKEISLTLMFVYQWKYCYVVCTLVAAEMIGGRNHTSPQYRGIKLLNLLNWHAVRDDVTRYIWLFISYVLSSILAIPFCVHSSNDTTELI